MNLEAAGAAKESGFQTAPTGILTSVWCLNDATADFEATLLGFRP
jgi:hypothetical protein